MSANIFLSFHYLLNHNFAWIMVLLVKPNCCFCILFHWYMLWLDAGVASFLGSLQNKPLQACSPCLQAQLINKALESMRNILAMLAHCHKSLTFDINQVHVLMLSSAFTVLLYPKSSVRQHWLRDSSSPRGMDMFCVGRAYGSGCRNIACHSLHVVHV